MKVRVKHKAQLSLISRMLLLLRPEDEDLSKLKDKVCKLHFELSLKLCHSLHSEDKGLTSLNNKTGVQMPRLEVPKFDVNFVNWQLVWEQYHISVHDRT